MPFDIRMRRVLSYHMPVESQRGEERRLLQGNLEDAVKATPAAAQPPSLPVRSPVELATDLLVGAISASSDLVADFGALAQRIADTGAEAAARAVYEGFTRVVELYNKPQGFSGAYFPTEFELAKFLGALGWRAHPEGDHAWLGWQC